MKRSDKREIITVLNALDATTSSLYKHKDALMNNGIPKEMLKRSVIGMSQLYLELSVIRNKNSFGVDEDD